MREVAEESRGGRDGWFAWLWKNRASTRLAFVLRAVAMVLSALLSLYWARALVQAMGSELYGLLLTFLAITQLGGLGDLGLGGGIGIRMLQHLARGEEAEHGKRFLASARGAFLLLALVLVLAFFGAASWLPSAFRFVEVKAAGSLPLLFGLGGLGVGMLVVNSYFSNLNYVLGNVVAPIVPTFLVSQLALAGQVGLARIDAPLWAIYVVQLAATLVTLVVTIGMIRMAHPWIGAVRPVRLDWSESRLLVRSSLWVYLGSLGSVIYVATDRIVINAGFGAGAVPAYQFNYKLCELAIAFLVIASYVALPAIATRVLSLDPIQRKHGIEGTLRLQKLQAFSASAAGAGYLVINDYFIEVWQGAEFHVPLALQTAFALSLTVTIAGDVGIQLLGRLDHSAVRTVGLIIGGTGLLNIALSLLAMKRGVIVGIAAATVIAHSFASLGMAYATCRRLGLPWAPWAVRTWLLPVIAVALVSFARAAFPPVHLNDALLLTGAVIVVLASLALAIGLRWQMLVDEWRRLRASFH